MGGLSPILPYPPGFFWAARDNYYRGALKARGVYRGYFARNQTPGVILTHGIEDRGTHLLLGRLPEERRDIPGGSLLLYDTLT